MTLDTPSRRARIIAYLIDRWVTSGQVRGATDEPPGTYLETPIPWGWVFEGTEGRPARPRKLFDTTERALEVHFHQTYGYVLGDPIRDLHKSGRRILADQQTLIMSDFRLGGLAWLIEEGGNAIGTPVGTEQPIGVLSTIWVVFYDTPPDDPRA